MANPRNDELLAWVERVSMLFAADGIPPIAGRILGWLMVCEPPEQSAGQIAGAIGASRASLTTNIRMLLTMGLVTRRTRPGERTAYYRVDDDAWERVVRRQIESAETYLKLTDDGMDLLGADTERAARVRDARAVFTWLIRVFADAPPMPSGKKV